MVDSEVSQLVHVPKVVTIGSNLSVDDFVNYYEGNLPQTFRVDKAEIRPQDSKELHLVKKGDLFAARYVKSTEVLCGTLPKRKGRANIPRNSGVTFALLPREGNEISLLQNSWEKKPLTASSLAKVKPFPMVAKILEDCTDQSKIKVSGGTLLFNLSTYTTKVTRKRGIKGVTSAGVSHSFLEGDRVSFSTKIPDTKCKLEDFFPICQSPTRARVYSVDSTCNYLHSGDLIIFEDKSVERLLFAKKIDIGKVAEQGHCRAEIICRFPTKHCGLEVSSVILQGYQAETLPADHKVMLRSYSEDWTNTQQPMANTYVDGPANNFSSPHKPYEVNRNLKSSSTLVQEPCHYESICNLTTAGTSEPGDPSHGQLYRNVISQSERQNLTIYKHPNGCRTISRSIDHLEEQSLDLSNNEDHLYINVSITKVAKSNSESTKAVNNADKRQRKQTTLGHKLCDSPNVYETNVSETVPDPVYEEINILPDYKAQQQKQSFEMPSTRALHIPPKTPAEPKVMNSESFPRATGSLSNDGLEPIQSEKSVSSGINQTRVKRGHSGYVITGPEVISSQLNERIRIQSSSQTQMADSQLPSSSTSLLYQISAPESKVQTLPSVKPKPVNPKLQAEPEAKHLMRYVSQKIGKEWSALGTLLGLEKGDLEEAEYAAPNSLKEKCHKVLMYWIEGKGRKPVSWTILLEALKQAKQTCLADDLRRRIITNSLDSDDY